MWQTPARTHDSIANRLGWLDSIDWMRERVGALESWAREVREGDRFSRVVLLGMGGSSLAPLVFSSLFRHQGQGLPLQVVDTTCPEDIARVKDAGVRDSLFIVSSKSGTTIETASLYRYFFDLVATAAGDPGDQFVAITDEHSWLQHEAQDRGFCKVLLNPADIGGRYSALSYFGLAPAALLGIDVANLLDEARLFAESTRSDDPATNAALDLGRFMGEQWLAGRDKMLLELPAELESLGMWIEQLVAESTGKEGKGIVPVICGPRGAERALSSDAFRVRIGSGSADEKVAGDRLRGWSLPHSSHIGSEFFRWEFATAIAATWLEINPFDEPNVSEAKDSTRRFVEGEDRLVVDGAGTGEGYGLFFPRSGEGTPPLADAGLTGFLDTLAEGTYLGLLAYLPEQDAIVDHLKRLGEQLGGRYGIVSTLGMGPRYLHSTGQLHKGGAGNGRFIQFVTGSSVDLAIPEQDYSFADLFQAQADGDFAVLARRGMPVMRVQLDGDRLRALDAFATDTHSVIARAGG